MIGDRAGMHKGRQHASRDPLTPQVGGGAAGQVPGGVAAAGPHRAPRGRHRYEHHRPGATGGARGGVAKGRGARRTPGGGSHAGQGAVTRDRADRRGERGGEGAGGRVGAVLLVGDQDRPHRIEVRRHREHLRKTGGHRVRADLPRRTPQVVPARGAHDGPRAAAARTPGGQHEVDPGTRESTQGANPGSPLGVVVVPHASTVRHTARPLRVFPVSPLGMKPIGYMPDTGSNGCPPRPGGFARAAPTGPATAAPLAQPCSGLPSRCRPARVRISKQRATVPQAASPTPP